MVMTNPKMFAGRIDTLARLNVCREDTQVDVSHECSQQQQAIALLDERRHLLFPHRSLVQSDIEWVGLTNDTLAQDGGGDRNPSFLGQRQQLVLQPKAMDLDAGQDQRTLALVEQATGFFDSRPTWLGRSSMTWTSRYRTTR